MKIRMMTILKLETEKYYTGKSDFRGSSMFLIFQEHDNVHQLPQNIQIPIIYEYSQQNAA